MKQRYAIGDDDGHTTTILLESHTQHIWHTSEASVSARTLARIKRVLGDGPYTNPAGNFGRATRIILSAR